MEVPVVPKEFFPFVEALLATVPQGPHPRRGSLTFLSGPLGAGQSRILDAALRRSEDPSRRVHRVVLSDADAQRPFVPVGPLVQRSAERARNPSSSYSLFLTPFLGRPGTLDGGRAAASSSRRVLRPSSGGLAFEDPHQKLLSDLEFYKRGVEAWGDRSRFIHEVGESILALSQEEPTLWLLEGIEHLDAHSWSVLRYLADRLEKYPLVIWATLDLEDGAAPPPPLEPLLLSPGVRCIELPRLSRDGVAELLARWVPRGAISPQFVEVVEMASKGRPVYVEEIARGEIPSSRKARPTAKAGPKVEDLAMDRVARLSTVARGLLTELSLLGGEFTLEMASKVSSLPTKALTQDLRGLVQDGFLLERPEETYAFSVPELVDELQRRLPKEEGHRLHRRVAEALESTPSQVGPQALLVADHWWASEDWSRAARANLRAAQYAQEAYAPEAALRYAKRAEEALTQGGKADGLELGTVLVEQGQALYDLGRLKESKKVLDGALKKIGKGRSDRPVRARALFLLARTLGGLGRGEDTFPLVEEANAALSEVEDTRGQLMLHQVVGVSLMMTGKNEDAATHFRAMMHLADELGDPRERSYAQKNLSAVLLSINPRDEEGMSLVSSALEHHRRTNNYAGLAAGHFNRALTLLDLGDRQKAVDDLRRSHEAAERAHAPILVTGAVLTEAGVLLEDGDSSSAKRTLKRVEPWVGTLETPYDRSGYLLLLGRVEEAEGRPAEAERAYVRALREAEAAEEPISELWEAHLRLALLARGRGDGAAAESHRKALPSPTVLNRSGSASVKALLTSYD
ncbi:MAG: hypothetical protein KGJ69_14695, partial [Thermoplasmata archaeon]|nr:hypothetical protein [Thermoplasmata archaeon]